MPISCSSPIPITSFLMLIHHLLTSSLVACLFVHCLFHACSHAHHLFVASSPTHSLPTCLHIAYLSPPYLHVTSPFACHFFVYVLHVPHLHVTYSLFMHRLCLACLPMCHMFTYPPNMLFLACHLLHNIAFFLLLAYTSFRIGSPTSIKINFF
jgi:hypothetical protein